MGRERLEKEPVGDIPEDIALAVEALTELKNSHGPGGGQIQEGHELREPPSQQQHQPDDTLLAKVRTNALIDNAVKVYKKSKNQYPSFRKGAEMVERKALLPMVKRLEERRTNKRRLESLARQEAGEMLGVETEIEIDQETENGELRSSGPNKSKKQKITNAIAKSKSNLKGYQLNMSIESKKRLVTCLHLLKLANYQLSNRVSFLQDLVQKEQQLRRGRIREYNTGRKLKSRSEKSRSGSRISEKSHNNDENENSINHEDDRKDEDKRTSDTEEEDGEEEEEDQEEGDDEGDCFYDASDKLHEQSDVVKMEIVGTVKKVYSLVSKFTGNSLPEPARTQVRESLLQLPSAWTSSMNSDTLSKYTNSKRLTRNGKVLILAQESLGMVHSVMDIVDGTLGKAEEWVKQKQEIKELLKEQYLSSKMRESAREAVSKEKEVN
ncbi:LAFA_0F07426g1_1 [Lachancea sp. 'fantastica']|nr:LAFA_0F07426g1_1 [Lachancea sp. 'fantastica']